MNNYINFILLIILIILIKSNLKKFHKKKKFIIVNRKLILNKVKIFKNKKVIILNNVLNNPNYCLKFLLNNFNYLNSDPSNYPGNRINTPIKLKKEIIQLMLLMNKKHYKFEGNIYVSDLFFSIINKPKNELTLKNVFPHRDCSEFNDHKKSGLAIVIYLCKPNNNYGGTKIYNSKYPIFSREFRTDKKYKDVYNKYINLSNNLSYDTKFDDFFDLIYNCKLEFNKGIIYPTDYFHKADITNNYFTNNNTNNNPRYTLTGFLFFDKNKKSDVYNTNNDDLDFKLMNDWYIDGSENKVINPEYYL
jgi:hypothetical protein